MPPGERRAWLEAECGEDPTLIGEVLALLERGQAAGIDKIVDEAAADYVSELPEGERLGPYRILDTLGRGGMGQVYLAQRADDEFRQRVAIKTVGFIGVAPHVVERFRAERQILADLEHPHIARLLDGGQAANGTPYLVMEYVDGRSIVDYCSEKRLSIDERLGLFLKVCDAVRYAHRKLVIHRDIKPSNILIATDGNPRLLDFGIAKLLEEEPGTAMTRADMRVLTPEFASPEQVRGEPATVATDVYGLGLLLYQLLTGLFPYEVSNASSPEIERIICMTEPTAPSTMVARRRDESGQPELGDAQLAKTLKGDLDNIVMMALRKEPERRYESVGDLARDVENYLARRPVAARTPSFRYRAGRFVARHRAAVISAAAVLVTIIAMTSWYTWRLAIERDTALRERQTAEAATDFMIDLFETSKPGRSLGETLTAREVLDRGAEKLREDLPDTPIVRARLLHTLGTVYERLGLYDEAERLLEEGADLSRRALPRGNDTQVATLEELAWIHYRREDWDRAAELASEALAIRESLVGPDDPSLSEALNQLGTIAFWRDDMDATLAYYNRALSILEDDDEFVLRERAKTLNHLGITYAHLGRDEEAERSYLESLEMRLELYEDGHPRIGAAKANLASFYLGKDRPVRARPYAEDALEIDRAVLGEHHADVAFDLGLLAAVHTQLGDYEKALGYAKRSADTWHAAVGGDHTRYGSAVDRVATILMELGELDRALEEAEECYDVMLTANGPGHTQTANALYTRGRVHLRRGEVEAARTDLERALAIRGSELGEDDDEYWSTRLVLAHTELASGNHDAAEKHATDVLALAVAAEPARRSYVRRALTVYRDVLVDRDEGEDAVRLAEVESRLAALGK